jgi:hypothetical protein
MHFTTLCREHQKGDTDNKGVKKNVREKSMERKLKREEYTLITTGPPQCYLPHADGI